MPGLEKLCVITIFLVLAACTSKKSAAPEVASLPRSETGSVGNGRTLYKTCAPCHGDKGEGNASLHSPGLANIEGWYAYRQLKNFKAGLRGFLSQDSSGAQMALVAQTLDTTEMLDLIAYVETFADLKMNTHAAGDVKKGERTYQTVCGSCHGPGAKGNILMQAPGLNGLEPWYLKVQIAKFKTSLRGAHPRDVYGAQMVPMVALLKDEQSVDDVVAYIQSITPIATK
ncbi:MAG TPA: c-type cytochrome [Chryseolinea sp.]